jgi:predicted  nucleic acid-binding Zn-ribbon protein
LSLPPKSNAIIELEKAVEILQVRVDATIKAIRGDLDDLDKDSGGTKSRIHQLDTQVVRIEEALKHLKDRLDRSDPDDRLARIEEKLNNATKELDKLRSNRFEIGKVILAAFFSFLGAGIFFLLNVLYQWFDKLKR